MIIRRIYRWLRANYLHAVIPVSREAIFAAEREGIEVVGFFRTASGLGESARQCAVQLQQQGYKVRCISVEGFFRKPGEIEWDFVDTASEAEVGCRILHLNPPMLPPVIFNIGLRRYRKVFNVGVWAWELEKLPREWRNALPYMNAITCPSNFTVAAIRQYTDKTVLPVPHPVIANAPAGDLRGELGIPASTFLVAAVFSFGSALERKNPVAMVKAFNLAFADYPNAHLLFKTNGPDDSAETQTFLAMIKDNPKITVRSGIWPREKVMGLLSTADACLSLHRSEGFGLTMAEAMLLGTPVVATDWSGNTDFCNADNSYPVRYRRVPVISTHPEFANMQDLTWADADVEHASALLRAILLDPETAKRKVAAARRVQEYFSLPAYSMALKAMATEPQTSAAPVSQ
jgi:glycosyltransferase involved in cell wall biosynthesis